MMEANLNHTNLVYQILDTTAHLVNGIIGIQFFVMVLVILFLMIFVFKIYKTTLQRLILYYIILGLWYELSSALQILEYYIQERWVYIIVEHLQVCSVITLYTYIMIITNFSLLLVPCLMRGTPVSKRSIKYVECISVPLTVITALVQVVILSIMQVENDFFFIFVSLNPTNLKCNLIYRSVYLAINVEVLIVSLSLSIFFCFIRQRIPSRQTFLMLRNLIYHFGINAFITTAYCIGAACYIYADSLTVDVYTSNVTFVILLEDSVVSAMLTGAVVIIQAIFCICTSSSKMRNTCFRSCCKTSHHQHYAVIDGTILLQTQLLVVSVNLATPPLLFPTLEASLKSLKEILKT